MRVTRPRGVFGEGETQFCNGEKCFVHPHMMVDVLFVTAQSQILGQFGFFKFLQELPVGAEPPALRFTAEICLRE